MLAAMRWGGNPSVASAAGQHEAGNYEETSDGQDGDRAKDCSSYGGNKGPLHTLMRSLDQSFELGIACGVPEVLYDLHGDCRSFLFPLAVLFCHGHGNLPSGQSSTTIKNHRDHGQGERNRRDSLSGSQLSLSILRPPHQLRQLGDIRGDAPAASPGPTLLAPHAIAHRFPQSRTVF